MTFYPTTTRDASRVDPPDNWISIGGAAEDVLRQVAERRARRARFAREAVNAAFRRHARALDQADFIDRLPREMPAASPEARFA